MKNKSNIFPIIILIIIFGLAFFMISLDDKIEEAQTIPTEPEVIEPVEEVTVITRTITEDEPIKEIVIEIGSGYFNPDEITVPVGTTVIWENNDRRAHRIADDPPNREFYGDRLVPGETYSFTFTREGVYNYYDVNFFAMKGTITVESELGQITGRAFDNNGKANYAGAAFIILIGVIMAFIVSREKR